MGPPTNTSDGVESYQTNPPDHMENMSGVYIAHDWLTDDEVGTLEAIAARQRRYRHSTAILPPPRLCPRHGENCPSLETGQSWIDPNQSNAPPPSQGFQNNRTRHGVGQGQRSQSNQNQLIRMPQPPPSQGQLSTPAPSFLPYNQQQQGVNPTVLELQRHQQQQRLILPSRVVGEHHCFQAVTVYIDHRRFVRASRLTRFYIRTGLVERQMQNQNQAFMLELLAGGSSSSQHHPSRVPSFTNVQAIESHPLHETGGGGRGGATFVQQEDSESSQPVFIDIRDIRLPPPLHPFVMDNNLLGRTNTLPHHHQQP